MQGATQALAEFVANTKFADIPSDVIDNAKLMLLDWEHVVKQDQYMDKIFAAYGFPKIDRR